ncbi:hypothetical protein N802_01380 [Knoellia sinensis KCTC 19936]|uniref:Uncharacterized protein n=2 Tax=Knoellia TaxID=136099 RepID=A0A0A0JCE2_9MICO|nr:hypothetical protein N802_01380 [Knoellia sinensis KCTC 19936]
MVALRGRETLVAIAAAAVLGVLLTLAPALDRVLLLIASVGALLSLAALGTWLVRDHHEVEWTTSAGSPARVRGSDRRVTVLARTIDGALSGDEAGRQTVRSAVRSVAESRLHQRGLPLDVSDVTAAAALGPDLTAYLNSPTAPQVNERQLASFITTLEEI